MVRRHGSAVLLLRIDMGVKVYRDDNWRRITNGVISRKDIMNLDGEKDRELIGYLIAHAPEPCRSSMMEYAAKKYGMDLIFFFGHDHSKGEKEFLKQRGEAITSTVSFANQTDLTQTLQFTYGHAGYLSSRIGSADNRYTFLTWDDENIALTSKVLGEEKAVTNITRLENTTPVYQFTEGEHAQVTAGEELVFRISRNINDDETYAMFAGIQIDGNDVSKENYDTASGSIIITLHKDYVRQLNSGEHTLRVLFKDGAACETGFTVSAKKKAAATGVK